MRYFVFYRLNGKALKCYTCTVYFSEVPYFNLIHWHIYPFLFFAIFTLAVVRKWKLLFVNVYECNGTISTTVYFFLTLQRGGI